MSRKLIINFGVGETRIALIENGVPVALTLMREHEPSLLGLCFAARVTKVSAALDGVFIDFDKKQGFLPKRNIIGARKSKAPLGSLLHEGQEIAIEIVRDAIKGDQKLAVAKQIVTIPENQDTHFIANLLKQKTYQNIDELIIDDLGFLNTIKPALAKAVNGAPITLITHYKDSEDIFGRFGVDDKINEVLVNKITLPSGGWLSVEATNALTAIDVNSAQSDLNKQTADHTMKTNLEAVKAIAAALRFQNIGGLIVVDFLDMAGKKAKSTIEAAMKQAVSNDPNHVECGAISPFGLYEIKRQKQGQGLRAKLMTNFEQTREDVTALELLRGAKKLAHSSGRGHVEIKAPKPVIKWLEANKHLIAQLQTDTARPIILKQTEKQNGSVNLLS